LGFTLDDTTKENQCIYSHWRHCVDCYCSKQR